MAYPEKKERNKQIVKLRKKGWPYRKLAQQFNIDVRRVYEVVKQDELRVVDKAS